MISIIVPVYNVEKYLKRCVDSILAQTFTDFELILVDDGSPDNSGRICDEYAQKDSRVKVIHQKNQGPSAARNSGIECSDGKYIMFIDSDDYIEPDYLENFYCTEYDLVVSGFSLYNSKDLKISSKVCDDRKYDSKRDIDILYLCDLLCSPWCKLFNSSIIKNNNVRFPLDISWGEDGMFVADYISHINNAKVLSYNGYHYIKYDTSISLTTKVREDIIDMVVYSREYYLSRLLEISCGNKDEIAEKVVNDICENCAYFVFRVFESAVCTKKKIELLKKFIDNKYVKKTIDDSEKYYNKFVRYALLYPIEDAIYKYKEAKRIEKIKQIKRWIYKKIPNKIKSIIKGEK